MSRVQNRPGAHGIVLAALLACIAGPSQGAETLQFRLHDAQGREVQSQDYKGRPVFLEFGACW
ncbi:MAG: hypothetical protein JW741_18920 [Sedimentisphaerales bacterium]|nr:hypothetical protein [Sedimentisphaerales bacterium]